MDPWGAFVWRVVGPLSPSLKARLLWARGRGDRTGRLVVDGLLSPGSVGVDVGANIGLYTDRMARLVGATGRVHAFEPNPLYASALQRIAAARGNVDVRAVALSDRAGIASLAVPGGNGALGTLERRPGEHDAVPVPTSTLDTELEGVGEIAVLKCDVEGHEHEVLLGASEVLGRARPVLLLEIEQRHRSRPLAETFALLAELGYEGHVVRPEGPAPLATFDVERDQLEQLAANPDTPTPPAGYVNDFVFVPAGRGLPWAGREG